MSSFRTRTLALALAFVLAAAANAQDARKETITKLAKEMGDALLKGDYAKMVDQTHPAAIKELGGREQAIKTIGEALKQIEAAGMKILSYSVGDVSDLAKEGDNTFAIVKTKMQMSAPKVKVHANSYLLAISSDDGKTWHFLDGSGLADPEVRKKLLPKLPEKFELPAPQEPEIIKE